MTGVFFFIVMNRYFLVQKSIFDSWDLKKKRTTKIG
jgi:hypothetical protein